MERTIALLAAALLLIAAALVLFAGGPVPEPDFPPTDLAPISFGPIPAEAAAWSGEAAAADAILRGPSEDSGSGELGPLRIEVHDRALGGATTELPLQVSHQRDDRHDSSKIEGVEYGEGGATVPRDAIPESGELLIEIPGVGTPLLRSTHPVRSLRDRANPLVLEIDSSAIRTVQFVDPGGIPISSDFYTGTPGVELMPGDEAGVYRIVGGRPGVTHCAVHTYRRPSAEFTVPEEATARPTPVIVPDPWSLRIWLPEVRDPARYSVRVILDPSMKSRPYWRVKYNDEPARVAEGTTASFRETPRRSEDSAFWTVGFAPNGEAHLTGFLDRGPLALELLDLGEPVASRSALFEGLGGEVVVTFEVHTTPPVLEGRIVDDAGAPIVGARLLLDPDDGRYDDHPGLHRPRDSVPPVEVRSDDRGNFRLPALDTMTGNRVLIHAEGFGRRVFTLDELRRMDAVVLRPGRTVRMTAYDRNGRPASETTSWSTSGAWRLEGLVELEHGVWRRASRVEWSTTIDRHGHDAGIGDVWIFDDLPEGRLHVSLECPSSDSWVLHDTSVPNLQWVGDYDNEDVMLGK